jgi:hypothetical protein
VTSGESNLLYFTLKHFILFYQKNSGYGGYIYLLCAKAFLSHVPTSFGSVVITCKLQPKLASNNLRGTVICVSCYFVFDQAGQSFTNGFTPSS